MHGILSRGDLAVARLGRVQKLLLASGKAQEGAEQVVGPTLGELSVFKIVRRRAADRSHIGEVESGDSLGRERPQLFVIPELARCAVRVNKRVSHRRRFSSLRIVRHLLHHPDEGGKARTRTHHHHVLSTFGPLVEREVADDAVHVAEGVAHVGAGGKERLRESPESPRTDLFQRDVDLEFSPGLRLIWRRSDGVRVRDRPKFRRAVLVERGFVVNPPVRFLDLGGQFAVLAGERDVLPGLVVGESGAPLSLEAEGGEPRGHVRPRADRPDPFFRHAGGF